MPCLIPPFNQRRNAAKIAAGMLYYNVTGFRSRYGPVANLDCSPPGAPRVPMLRMPAGGDRRVVRLSLAKSIAAHFVIAIALVWVTGRATPLIAPEPETIAFVFEPAPSEQAQASQPAQVSEPAPPQPIAAPEPPVTPPPPDPSPPPDPDPLPPPPLPEPAPPTPAPPPPPRSTHRPSPRPPAQRPAIISPTAP
jgi:hypothetical protein